MRKHQRKSRNRLFILIYLKKKLIAIIKIGTVISFVFNYPLRSVAIRIMKTDSHYILPDHNNIRVLYNVLTLRYSFDFSFSL